MHFLEWKQGFLLGDLECDPTLPGFDIVLDIGEVQTLTKFHQD